MVPSAEADFDFLRGYDRSRLRDAIAAQLVHEPTKLTRHRKLLAINPVATWELRVGDLRILYDVDDAARVVLITAIGRKVHDKLVIRGEVLDL